MKKVNQGEWNSSNIFTHRRQRAQRKSEYIKPISIWVSILLVALIGAAIATAAFVITLTDMKVENIQIFRQSVVIDEETGETEMQMKMSMNYTLTDGTNNKGMNTEFTLSAAQRTAVLNFIKPFVQAQATTDGVNAPAWAQ